MNVTASTWLDSIPNVNTEILHRVPFVLHMNVSAFSFYHFPNPATGIHDPAGDIHDRVPLFISTAFPRPWLVFLRLTNVRQLPVLLVGKARHKLSWTLPK